MLKSLAFNHWAIESTHWQRIHSPTSTLSSWGLKRKFYFRTCTNAPVIYSTLYFHNITESEAVGGKRKWQKIQSIVLHQFGPIDTQLCISFAVTNVALRTVLNRHPVHRSCAVAACRTGNQFFIHQLQWLMGLQYSPAQCDFIDVKEPPDNSCLP